MDYDDTMDYSEKVNYPKLVFSVIICVAGLLGNLVVIFIIFILKEYKKSVTHWYVLQLAIADSIFLLTLPFKVNEDLNGRWDYPEWMCKAKETVLFINYNASIFFLMIMSFDRYIAVCHSFSNIMQRFRTQISAIIIAITAWIIAIALSTPVMVYTVKYGIYPECKCTHVFPSPPTNKTEECINEGLNHTEKDIEDCLRLGNTDLEPYDGEIHCRVPNPEWEKAAWSSFYPEPTGDSKIDSPTATEDTLSSSYYDPNEYYDGEYYENHTANRIPSSCHYWEHPRGWITFLRVNFVVMFLLPFSVMIACYGLIIFRLASTTKLSSNLPSSPNTLNTTGFARNRKRSVRSEKYRRRVTIMCAALVIAFVVCWLPFHAVHLAKIAGIQVSPEHQNICTILPEIGSLLAYLNSALNPYLYTFLGTNFTRRWHETTSTLRRSIKKKRSTSSIGSVRFTRKPSTDLESKAHNTGTVTTKIYRHPHERTSHLSECSRSLDGNNVTKYPSEVQHLNAITQVPIDNIEKENSPLDPSKDPITY